MNSSSPLTTFIESLIAQGKISTFRKTEILRAFQTSGYKTIGDLTNLSNEEWNKMRLPPVTVKNLQDSLASLSEGSPVRSNNSRVPSRTSETPDRKTINTSISKSPGNVIPVENVSTGSNSVQTPITPVSPPSNNATLPRQNSTNNNTKAQAITKNEFSSKLAGIIGTGPPPVSTTANVSNDREIQENSSVSNESENTPLFPTKSRPKNPGRRVPTNPSKKPKPLPEPKKYRAADLMDDSMDQGTYSEYDLINAKEENTPDTSLDGSEFSDATYKSNYQESVNEYTKNNDRSISHGNQDRNRQVTRNTPRATPSSSLSPATSVPRSTRTGTPTTRNTGSSARPIVQASSSPGRREDQRNTTEDRSSPKTSTDDLFRNSPSSSSTPLSSTPPTLHRNTPAAGMNNPTRATSYRNGVSTNTRPTPLLSLGLNNVQHDRTNSGHALDQGLGSTDRRRENEPDIDDMTDEEIDSEYGKLIDELLALG